MAYKQLIIARQDLNMSPGKLAAQVAHASMAFLTTKLRNVLKKQLHPNIFSFKSGLPYRDTQLQQWAEEAREEGKEYFYVRPVDSSQPYGPYKKVDESSDIMRYTGIVEFDKDLVEQWINGSFTKVVAGARSKARLLKAIEKAKELGWVEGIDYFPIYDTCRTELEPEEEREDGVGAVLTCVGFRPMEAKEIDKIGKDFHLY